MHLLTSFEQSCRLIYLTAPKLPEMNNEFSIIDIELVALFSVTIFN